MSRTVIVNARLVNEGKEFDADLLIEGGRIARIDSHIAPAAGDTVVDAAGRWLLPGMIDDLSLIHISEPTRPY